MPLTHVLLAVVILLVTIIEHFLTWILPYFHEHHGLMLQEGAPTGERGWALWPPSLYSLSTDCDWNHVRICIVDMKFRFRRAALCGNVGIVLVLWAWQFMTSGQGSGWGGSSVGEGRSRDQPITAVAWSSTGKADAPYCRLKVIASNRGSAFMSGILRRANQCRIAHKKVC